MIAASNGSTEILKAMGRGPSLLDLKDADGGTAAMSAAVHKHSSVLDFVRLPRITRAFPRVSTSASHPEPRAEAIALEAVSNAPIALVPRSTREIRVSRVRGEGSFRDFGGRFTAKRRVASGVRSGRTFFFFF